MAVLQNILLLATAVAVSSLTANVDSELPSSFLSVGQDDEVEQGKGALIVPGGNEASESGLPVGNATKEPAKKETACMCKKTSELGSPDQTLSAGWKKRATRCEADETPSPSDDPEKCTVVKVECHDKEEMKNNVQCKANKHSKSAAAKLKEAGAKAGAAAKPPSTKCLSKFCSDADNLNRPKGSKNPSNSMGCYDTCSKSHCVKLFDSGWEHWYECIQTCIGNCFNVVDE